jgi:hypothetical protein
MLSSGSVDMRDKRTYKIFPSNLSLRDAFQASGESLRKSGYSAKPDAANYEVEVDDCRLLSSDDWDEFVAILGRFPAPNRVSGYGGWVREKDQVQVSFFLTRTSISLAVDSRDLAMVEFLHSRLQECFHASNVVTEKSQGLADWNLKKTIFLAHRFDEQGKMAFTTVERFLSRCGFSVVDGQGYEAGRIPAKVAERIENQDILLAVVTPGDSTWITSEAAYAHGLKKYVVLLAEEGTAVKKGILGSDYEHLLFPPGNIEKAFSDLLYALPS